MLKDFVRAEYKTVIERALEFRYGDDWADGGFSFPCDENGKVLPLENGTASANLEWCMAHPEKFKAYAEVHVNRRRVKEPAHGKCVCGREVELWDQYYGACSCECGRWYNLFGQELLSPEHWETDPSMDEYY